MPGEAAAIAAVAELLSKVFGYAVEPDGYQAMSLEAKLEKIEDALAKSESEHNWPAVAQLNAELDCLRARIV